MAPKWMVIRGCIVSGMTFFGPFDSEELAREWIGMHEPLEEWDVLPLRIPVGKRKPT